MTLIFIIVTYNGMRNNRIQKCLDKLNYSSIIPKEFTEKGLYMKKTLFTPYFFN